MKIFIDKKYRWYEWKIEDVRLYIAGGFWIENNYYEKKQACQKLFERFFGSKTGLGSSVSIISLAKVLTTLRGHFSAIIESPHFSLAFVDRIQSYPIYYFKNNEEVCVSNSAIAIRNIFEVNQICESSLLEFEMAGYVTGKYTIFENLFQLQAGEFLIFDVSKKNLETKRYYLYYPSELQEKNEEELLESLHQCTLKTFSQMIETLEGRPVWVPLSGGYDSRLVLSLLLDLKYDNIKTFSYGPPWLWEVGRAREIVNFLNVKWYFIPYLPKEIKSQFHTEDRQQYFEFASGCRAVPCLNDYYALRYLRKKKLITDDAIIINGQSGDFTSGGHIPIIPNVEKIEVEHLFEAIIDKHFSLWLDLKTKENLDIIIKKLSQLIHVSQKDTIYQDEFPLYYEQIEWQERQSKYVVNGQRVYDWFGYDWRLPLWSDELMEFWVQVPWQIKQNQKLYITYLEKYDPSSVFKKEWVKKIYSPVDRINLFLYVYGKLFKKDPEKLYQKFTRYFMSYGSFYPQNSYFEYLKDSKDHRNVVSYYAKILKKEFKNNLS